MSHRRRHHHRRGMDFDDLGRNGGFFGIFDLVFGIVSMALEISFGVVEMVFKIINGIFGYKPKFNAPHSSNGMNNSFDGSSGSNPNYSNDSCNTGNNNENCNNGHSNNGYSNSSGYSNTQNNAHSNSSTNNTTQNTTKNSEASNSKTEPSKEAPKDAKKKNEKQGNDWNVMIFVFTIIFGVAALASGKFLYAGLIASAGILLMLFYSTIRGIRRSIKNRATAAEAKAEEKDEKEDDSVEKLIKEAFEKVFAIRKDLHLITRPEIKQKVEALCDLAEDIIGEARTNAESLQAVRKFFYYYLDAFGEIFKKYIRISNFSESSEEIGKMVEETEKSFSDIEDIFKGLLGKTLEKDVMNLKAEINVIKNSG